eukprot:TRINITY_DN8396_c0_g1_i2.p1 TRINITY_DN8396_c0_g1~~TRINITY_DN8396_c0_g1_i2.p1  ORF type:complete len:213 (-),score=70.03 TRINITY_DN8396_c0_g1_i2:368-1006(-)
MGNSCTRWHAKVLAKKAEVQVDLSQLHTRLPFCFERMAGEFDLPLNLGVRTIPVGDFVQLGRREEPLLAIIPVSREAKKRIDSLEDIGKSGLEMLKNGVSASIMDHESPWRRIARVETDLGLVQVEVRVVAKVSGMMQVEESTGSWLRKGGYNLVGRAGGTVEVMVRGRFETEFDRRRETVLTYVITAVIVLPAILIHLIRRQHSAVAQRRP